MKYKFIGLPVPYKGKPIWEIVGNLKNFGVGRIIVADEHKDRFKGPTFYKIVKVLPLDTPNNLGENRKVMVWAEHVLRGRKLTEIEQLESESDLTKFHLIPTSEEEKYLSGITTTPELTVRPKYQAWPPLFKKMWEERMQKSAGKYVPLPMLSTVIETGEKSFEVLATDDQIEPSATSDLYKTDVPVEELLKKIVLLRIELGIELAPEKET